jgi:hypothetical protein
MTHSDFGVFFRAPIFPVVGHADGRLFSARSLKGLIAVLQRLDRPAAEAIVRLVDSTGEEFWYTLELRVLSPGLLFKRWTKRQIIDLYNGHNRMNPPYPVHSLSNKRLSQIVGEIADLIRETPQR